MTTPSEGPVPLRLTPERLDELLAIYGARIERWPRRWQAPARALLTENAAARERVREAMALERVLAAAPPPDPVRVEALADRIMAALPAAGAGDAARAGAAQRTAPAGPAAVSGARIIAFEPKDSGRAPMQATQPGVLPAGVRGRGLQAASLLAASLMLGFYLGAAGHTGLPFAPQSHEADIVAEQALTGASGLVADILDEDAQ